jgi:hypothetical protein
LKDTRNFDEFSNSGNYCKNIEKRKYNEKDCLQMKMFIIKFLRTNFLLVIPSNQGLVDLPFAKGVVVGLRLFNREYDDLIKIKPELKDLPQISRLGFRELIMPGQQR